MSFSPNWCSNLAATKKSGAQIIFAKDIDDKGTKNYTSVLTHKQFLDYQETLPISERCFYEIILKDKPVKLFFDVDRTPAINDTLKDAIINEIVKQSIQAIKELYNIDISFQDFAVLDASGQVFKNGSYIEKTSFHIILVRKVCFSNEAVLKDFISKIFLKKNHDNKEISIIDGLDSGVYRPGCFRIPGSTKKTQNRPLKIVTPQYTELDCLITNTEHCDVVLSKTKIKQKQQNTIDEKKILQSAINEKQLSDDDIYLKCIDSLPNYLAEEYDRWVTTGIKLYVSKCPEKYWHLFSKRSSQYNEKECSKKWKSFYTYKQTSITTLFKYVSKFDSGFMVNNIKHTTLKFMGKYNNEIALGLARLYGEKHVFSMGKWYYFNDIRWIEDTYQSNISMTIMKDFYELIDREIRNIQSYLTNETNKDGTTYDEEHVRIQNLYTIKEKCQTGRIGNDWHVLNVSFDNPRFVEMLDENMNLIGFENGVYDLKYECFRDTKRNDFITFSVGYNYDDDVDRDTVRELDLLLEQIFPDPDIRDYILMFTSTCLTGEVHNEHIHFFTGLSNKQTGSNGKSTFVSLLLQVFGQYASCGHSSIITSKRESSQNANSAIMSLKNKRLVTFQEIDNENSINMPVIKSLTGNDLITGRQLYKTQESFLPQWKLIVCANQLPPVSHDDGGTRRRLRNVPFESKFVDNPEDTKWQHMEHIYMIDNTLKSKLKNYRMPLMLKLIEYYKRYEKNGKQLPECHKINVHTNDYFKENNLVYQFIKEHIRPHPDPSHEYPLKNIITQCYNSTKIKEEDIIQTLQEYFPQIPIIFNNNNRRVILGYTYIE